MSRRALEGSYDPHAVEHDWYQRWEREGLFRPELNPDGEPWCLVIPPPNVTGTLHMGHALEDVMMDAVTRFRRMQGRRALFLPGVDHAGIATQNVVETELRKSGQSRHDLGREAFVERVWQWKEHYHERIRGQIRKMAASCDWSRERFTMDEQLSAAVRKVFVQLYREGLIYRDERLINWCTRCRTALSDLEVEFEDREDTLYSIRYPGSDGSQGVVVATVRPETLFGDVAVAVHPEDERYRQLVGHSVKLALTGREIPVIADDYVKREFGTGALKITPAHDPNDFEIGRRHGFEPLNVISPEGHLTGVPERFEGLEVGRAREPVVEALEQAGLLVSTEPFSHAVGSCQRCGTLVEPLVSKQWFVEMKPLAERAINEAREGRPRFIPERWQKVYLDWLSEIRDWCVSRQLWWGHRIPAWYCGCGELIVSEQDPERCPACGEQQLEQDPDVLDTWFSSGLWPFSTLGWPDEAAEDLKTFFPTTLLITGYDIIFFWVARMVMLGLHMTGRVPFETVCIHGLIRDDKGRKMSKSKGNVIDPMELIDKHGTDPLRWGLAMGVTQGQDFSLTDDRFQAARFFLNKVWNAAKLINSRTPEDYAPQPLAAQEAQLRPLDRWLIGRLDTLLAEATGQLEQVELASYVRGVYTFAWGSFCDWYLEASKLELGGEDPARRQTVLDVLHHSLLTILKLMHPVVPTSSEEIHQSLAYASGTLTASRWPQPSGVAVDAAEIERVEALLEAIRTTRSLRSDLGLSPSEKAGIALLAEPALAELAREHEPLLLKLANLESIRWLEPDSPRPERALYATSAGFEVFLEVADEETVRRQLDKLDKEIARTRQTVDKLTRKLDNPGFLAKAPPEIVSKDRATLAEAEANLARLREQRQRLEA